LLDSLFTLTYNPAVFTGPDLRKTARPHKIWITLFLLALLTSCGLTGQNKLTISWTTESELDIIGFNLLRSETEDGPYSVINEELIPPSIDPNVGGEHSFIDRDVINGVTYYYKLETIDRQGNSTESDPIAITAGD
jgi:hypothetical protein